MQFLVVLTPQLVTTMLPHNAMTVLALQQPQLLIAM